MIVYRVEHMITGFGPYCTSSPLLWVEMGLSGTSDAHHPGPVVDGVFSSKFEKNSHQHYQYGFVEFDQLYVWFGHKGINAAFKHGYVISKYDVPARVVRKGKSQCAFHKAEADLIQMYDNIAEVLS